MDMVLNPLQKNAESLSGQEKVRSVYFLSFSLFQDLHSRSLVLNAITCQDAILFLFCLTILLIKEIVPKMSPI